jgi:fatty acid desaturase
MNKTNRITPTANSEYLQLKRLITQEGLLDKSPLYYLHKLIVTLALLGLSLTLIAIVNNFWFQLINSVFLAFVFGQLGFIGHDACHNQVFRKKRRNELLGLGCNLMIAISRSWWIDKHNRHHSAPNDPDLDPDSDFPILAFSEEQAYSKRGIPRLIVKYQAFLLLPLMLFEAINLRIHSVNFLISNGGKGRYLYIESIFFATHFVFYVAFLVYFLGPAHGIVFFLVNQALFGLYFGMSFAPNHKGMPLVEKMDFLHQQVITARNLLPNRFTDFFFGQLSCQIEHHLFTTMPRNNLRKAQKIVKVFCQERSISYYETGLFRSYKEIFQHLHAVSAPLRNASITPGNAMGKSSGGKN